MERYAANCTKLPNMSVYYPGGYSPCYAGRFHVGTCQATAIKINIIMSNLDYDIDKERRSTMNVRPLHDYVIVRRKEEDQLSTGGIIVPDTATEKPVQGEAVAVGNGRILRGECRTAGCETW